MLHYATFRHSPPPFTVIFEVTASPFHLANDTPFSRDVMRHFLRFHAFRSFYHSSLISPPA